MVSSSDRSESTVSVPLAAGRLAVLDDIKAAAILAVLLQHALPPFWEPQTAWESLADWLVQFHVPAFLMVSGFLSQRGEAMSGADLGRRLQRLLPPYLVASLFWWSIGSAHPWEGDVGLGWMLATGSVLPIYYYIFVQLACLLLLWPVSRLPRTGQWVLLGGLLLWHGYQVFDPFLQASLGFFWYARNPLVFFHYFLAGYLLAEPLMTGRGQGQAASEPLRPRPIWIVACAAALVAYVAICAFVPGSFGRGGAALRTICAFASVGLVWSASTHGHRFPGAAFLGPATYTLFLYHFPFATWLTPWTKTWTPELAVLVKLILPLLAASLLVVVGRRLLGRHSARWLGC
jgi:peptidoglycan/LPS O-acetylase OafA/YrhL